MCIALPMTVVSVDGFVAQVSRSGPDGEPNIQSVDAFGAFGAFGLEPFEPLRPGDQVLVFRGAVLRKVTQAEAQRIEAALACVAAVMAGENPNQTMIQEAFAELSPHLPLSD